jgi:hypothetical protein
LSRKTAMYRCAHCEQYYKRESRKAWIKSWCERSGRYTRLMRVRRAVAKDSDGSLSGEDLNAGGVLSDTHQRLDKPLP